MLLRKGDRVDLLNGSQILAQGVIHAFIEGGQALVNADDSWWLASCEVDNEMHGYARSFYRTDVDYVIKLNGEWIDSYGELAGDDMDAMRFECAQAACQYLCEAPIDELSLSSIEIVATIRP